MNPISVAILTVLVYAWTVLSLERLILKHFESVERLHGEEATTRSAVKSRAVVSRASAASICVVVGAMGVAAFDSPPQTAQAIGNLTSVMAILLGLAVFFGALLASLKYKTFFKYFS